MPDALADNEPDAFVYTDDNGVSCYLCARCRSVHEHGDRGLFSAWYHATLHLWSSHSLRRAWVAYHNPAHARGVQLALPIILAHDTTRAR